MNHAAMICGLIGKPYRTGSDGPDAFDCYGLAAYVQREVYGVGMNGVRPAVIDDESTINTLMEHPERREWRQVDRPVDGCLVLMASVEQRTRHLGTYVVVDGTGGVLHTTDRAVAFEDRNSLIVRGFSDIRYFVRK